MSGLHAAATSASITTTSNILPLHLDLLKFHREGWLKCQRQTKHLRQKVRHAKAGTRATRNHSHFVPTVSPVFMLVRRAFQVQAITVLILPPTPLINCQKE